MQNKVWSEGIGVRGGGDGEREINLFDSQRYSISRGLLGHGVILTFFVKCEPHIGQNE